jgi:hypothetical protein
MITKRYIASFVAPFFATYVARDWGTVDVGKIICFIEETVMSAGVIVLYKEVNLLRERFNAIISCFL